MGDRKHCKIFELGVDPEGNYCRNSLACDCGEEEIMANIYKEKGYDGRREYLMSLAEEYGVDYETVFVLSDTLGHGEDFDGLISALEDYVEVHGDEYGWEE